MFAKFMLPFVLAGCAFLVWWAAVFIGARRFARRRRREGAWDANGPRHPTEPPPGWGSIPGYLPPGPTIEHENPAEE